MGIESTLPGRRSLKLPGLFFHFVTVVVGAATGEAAGAVVAEVAGAVGEADGATGAESGATGAAASASAAGAAGSQQAGFSGTPASATAGASTFFSQPTRANAATNTIELIANLIFLSPKRPKVCCFWSTLIIYNAVLEVYTKEILCRHH